MAAGKQTLHAGESDPARRAGHDHGLWVIDIHLTLLLEGRARRLRLHRGHAIFGRPKSIRNAGNWTSMIGNTLYYSRAALILSAAMIACAPHAVFAQPAEPFFKGKVINLYIGFAPGGTYDYFGRVVDASSASTFPAIPLSWRRPCR